MDKHTILAAIDDPTVLGRDLSRRGMLQRTATAAVAALTVPAALAAVSSPAAAQAGALPNVIVNTLNLAYILERLDTTFYLAGLGTPGLIPQADRAVWQQIARNESAQVAYLEGVLGARRAQVPQFDYTAGGTLSPLTDYEQFKLVAQGFEDFAVRVYKGQAPNLASNDAILTVALQFHSVEARHASEIRRLRGLKGWITGDEPTAPAAFRAIYAGEGNTIQAGIDTSKYAGADAATEAFDEPVTDVRYVLQTISPFIKK